MITRFAPSPTGPLHLGHAFSALTAFDLARRQGGQHLLRIEDTDTARSRPEWEHQIYEDLAWLGVTWDGAILRQSDNVQAYEAALQILADKGLTYHCICNRADIRAALSAPQEGYGPDGLIYPGTCRNKSLGRADAAVRLNMQAAVPLLPAQLSWLDNGETTKFERKALVSNVGDIVLARRDTGIAAYHLAVVVDDAAQSVSHVVRGADLAEATVIHVVLQHLLGLQTPEYLHHRLVRDTDGKRLAKRDDARAIQKFREDGATPADIRRMVGL